MKSQKPKLFSKKPASNKYNRFFVNLLLNFYRIYLITFGEVVVKCNGSVPFVKINKTLRNLSRFAVLSSVAIQIWHTVVTAKTILNSGGHHGNATGNVVPHVGASHNGNQHISSTSLFLQNMLNVYFMAQILITRVTFERGGKELIKFLLKYSMSKSSFWKVMLSFSILICTLVAIVSCMMVGSGFRPNDWVKSVPFLYWVAHLLPTFAASGVIWTLAVVARGFLTKTLVETRYKLSRIYCYNKNEVVGIMQSIRKELMLFRQDFEKVNSALAPVLLTLIFGHIIAITLSTNQIINTYAHQVVTKTPEKQLLFIKITFVFNAITELTKLIATFVLSDSIQKKAIEIDASVDDFLTVNCASEENLISEVITKNPLYLMVGGIGINTSALLNVLSFILSYTVIIIQTS